MFPMPIIRNSRRMAPGDIIRWVESPHRLVGQLAISAATMRGNEGQQNKLDVVYLVPMRGVLFSIWCRWSWSWNGKRSVDRTCFTETLCRYISSFFGCPQHVLIMKWSFLWDPFFLSSSIWRLTSDHINNHVVWPWSHVCSDDHECQHIKTMRLVWPNLAPSWGGLFSIFSRPIILAKDISARGKLSEVSFLGRIFPGYFICLGVALSTTFFSPLHNALSWFYLSPGWNLGKVLDSRHNRSYY